MFNRFNVYLRRGVSWVKEGGVSLYPKYQKANVFAVLNVCFKAKKYGDGTIKLKCNYSCNIVHYPLENCNDVLSN